LALLLVVEENRKLFLAEDWGIIGLVLLLDTRFQEVGKQFPIAALLALSGNAKCRKQMATAGACSICVSWPIWMSLVLKGCWIDWSPANSGASSARL